MSSILSHEGRSQLNLLFSNSAKAFGVNAGDPKAGQELIYQKQQAQLFFSALKQNPAASELYSATPSRPQTAEQKIVQLANPFLSMLPMIGVKEMTGQKVLVGLSGRVASRTDTSSTGERTAKRLKSTGTQNYDLKPTEFDVALGYDDIDSWAGLGQNVFEQLYMQAVRDAISIDILQTGWTGTSAAATTDISTNPLLQDLNIGWLQKIRSYNSGSQYHIGTVGTPISIGTNGTYVNLDHAVRDARQTIAIQFRNRPDLVALISEDLVSSQENTYYKTNGNSPIEKIALADGVVRKAYGGLLSIVPPFMPNGTILITPLSNLAIYFQNTSVRRVQRDWPTKNEVQDFNSMNLGYVVQDENATSLVENITLV